MSDLPSLQLSNSSQPLSASDLDAIEKSLRYALPEDYKTFIMVQNGGVPDDELVFDFFDEATGSENTSAIRRFFPLDSEGNEAISPSSIQARDNLLKESLIPSWLLPIADDPFGNVIGISLRKGDRGSVYYLSHDRADADTGFMLASKLADRFDGFVGLLELDSV